jgi:hypothetical protein
VGTFGQIGLNVKDVVLMFGYFRASLTECEYGGDVATLGQI